MKPLMTALLLICFTSCCSAKESSVQKQEPPEPTEEQFMAELLKSNFEETPYTALVKITDVEKKGNEMLYPTFVYKCEVIETYKGKQLKTIEYWRGLETPPRNFPIGRSLIVSLFINEDGLYYLGDNGYDLPASEQLTEIARRLSKNAKKK